MSDEIRCDIPESFQYLLEPMRYKSAYGGRGRGASWSFARVLATKASFEKKRILCTREYQNSIRDSVYKVLTDQIEQLSLMPYYNINKTEISSKVGSEFIFKGLQHPLEIKSIEGIDVVWLEEAQNVSEDSWKFLIPTIRKEGSEIWMSWNTGSEDDPTYVRFVTNKPEDCISKLLSYKDNPYFPETLRKEMEYCKRVDYDAYLHIWEGKPEKLSHALVFKGKFAVEDFETPYGARFYYGADWGFANDPIALIRCFIVGNDLFIDQEACGVGVEFEEIPQLFDSVPGVREYEIPADSSRPETISYVKRQGFLVKSCRKSATTKAGFVKDGISFLRKFEKIHIHTRCKHVQDEFEHYSYKIDKKTGEVLPILLDSFNHCIDALRYSLEDLIQSTQTDWETLVNT
jgi:phage terminase large subunit